jgi:predicted nucleic acid-binding protein
MAAMNVVDANIVITFLARHSDPLYPAARQVLGLDSVIVPLTVLLEVEWVLRATYKFDAATAEAAIAQLLSLPNVESRPEGVAKRALDFASDGLDLPDALHLAATEQAEAFITADRALARKARRIPSAPRIELLQDTAP